MEKASGFVILCCRGKKIYIYRNGARGDAPIQWDHCSSWLSPACTRGQGSRSASGWLFGGLEPLLAPHTLSLPSPFSPQRTHPCPSASLGARRIPRGRMRWAQRGALAAASPSSERYACDFLPARGRARCFQRGKAAESGGERMQTTCFLPGSSCRAANGGGTKGAGAAQLGGLPQPGGMQRGWREN